ncbi:hypothetical protein [Aquimarina sp. 2201CG5-10]|uniref:hypothetical protein n=1 Tax=Aquimarina callyspongiae TaxID=3098150 RepID=UPI002AB370E7|nr:hypothetical protein [Aquimarina sp. 2201CG5-10]MDY8136065.1 hypothetical protein [Aquimarina sp. 2201CG5-10]
MYKNCFILLLSILLISCKQNNKNVESNTDAYEVETDTYQPTEEEIEKLRIEDSINIIRNRELLEKESILKKNGVYTDREDLITILLKLDFISGVKANSVELNEIVPDSNNQEDIYLKSCKYKSNTSIEFIDSSSMFEDSSVYPIAITSNLDSDFYYIEKISVFKNGDEIEISLKRISTEGNISNEYIKPFMVYHYNYYVLEFYDKSFAVKSIVDSLEVEECDEPERG